MMAATGAGMAGWTVGMPTLHGKGALIQQVFADLQWQVVELPVNTDALGTFSGEVERPADPLATACLKLDAAANLPFAGDALIASEGAFYPHPEVPMLTLNTEWLVLRHLRTHHQVSVSVTHYFADAAKLPITHAEALEAFALRLGFPQQGIILRSHTRSDLGMRVAKDAKDWTMLLQQYQSLKAEVGEVVAETDFRAMRCPLRQQHIAEAARQLREKWLTPCPQCTAPGFGRSQPLAGLPCSWCGTPTRLTRAWLHTCTQCQYQQVVPITGDGADPGQCDHCNP